MDLRGAAFCRPHLAHRSRCPPRAPERRHGHFCAIQHASRQRLQASQIGGFSSLPGGDHPNCQRSTRLIKAEYEIHQHRWLRLPSGVALRCFRSVDPDEQSNPRPGREECWQWLRGGFHEYSDKKYDHSGKYTEIRCGSAEFDSVTCRYNS